MDIDVRYEIAIPVAQTGEKPVRRGRKFGFIIENSRNAIVGAFNSSFPDLHTAHCCRRLTPAAIIAQFSQMLTQIDKFMLYP